MHGAPPPPPPRTRWSPHEVHPGIWEGERTQYSGWIAPPARLLARFRTRRAAGSTAPRRPCSRTTSGCCTRGVSDVSSPGAVVEGGGPRLVRTPPAKLASSPAVLRRPPRREFSAACTLVRAPALGAPAFASLGVQNEPGVPRGSPWHRRSRRTAKRPVRANTTRARAAVLIAWGQRASRRRRRSCSGRNALLAEARQACGDRKPQGCFPPELPDELGIIESTSTTRRAPVLKPLIAPFRRPPDTSANA